MAFFEPIAEFADVSSSLLWVLSKWVPADLDIPQGRMALVSLRQGVTVNPDGTLLDFPIIPGITWELSLNSADFSQTQVIRLRRTGANGQLQWTLPNGEPVVRNVLVRARPPLTKLRWKPVINAATLPATVTKVYGAMEGLLLSEDLADADLVKLLRLP